MVNDPPYFSYLSQILDKILLYFRLDKRVINFKIPQRLSYSVRKKGNKFWVRMWNIFSCSVVILSFFVGGGGKKGRKIEKVMGDLGFQGRPSVYSIRIKRGCNQGRGTAPSHLLLAPNLSHRLLAPHLFLRSPASLNGGF